MSLIRSAIRSSLSHRSSDLLISRSSLPFLHEWRKCLSTVTEQPPSSPSPPSPVDSPVSGSNKSTVEERLYGKLFGFSKYTLKSDVVNILYGCNLKADDVRFIYGRVAILDPVAVLVQFPSLVAYNNALKAITKKGKLYKLERAARSQFVSAGNSNGKLVALHGVPVNATIDDIDRFLSGCLYHHGIQFISIPGFENEKKVAWVRFTSEIQAMNAYITKNRTFLLNQRIMMQILH